MEREPRGRTVPTSAVDDATVEQMWRLFDQTYEAVERERFVADLREKDHVILLLVDDAVAGFSTVKVLEGEVDGRAYAAVYSGDTVVHPEIRGKKALQKEFLRYIMAVKLKNLRRPVFWFLISKGYKTYLLLSRNFHTYWPRPDAGMPPWHAAVLDQLARGRFGSAWDPARGTLVFDPCQGRLRPHVAPVDDAGDDPDIAFFVRSNPGHADGEELCCLGVIDLELGRRYVAKLARRGVRLARRTPEPERLA